MVKEDIASWIIEPIQNFLCEHLLFRRVHKIYWQHWDDISEIEENFFSIPRKIDSYELSLDWSKYCNQFLKFTYSTLDKRIYGVIKLIVGELKNLINRRNMPIQIRHDPITKVNEINPLLNRAHTVIEGLTRSNYIKIRSKLSEIAHWTEGFKPIKEQENV